MDSDKDGTVSQEEILDFLRGMAKSQGLPRAFAPELLGGIEQALLHLAGKLVDLLVLPPMNTARVFALLERLALATRFGHFGMFGSNLLPTNNLPLPGGQSAGRCFVGKGRNLLAALESGKEFHDIFGSPAVKFSPTNHLASAETMVQQIQNGRWKVIQTGLMF